MNTMSERTIKNKPVKKSFIRIIKTIKLQRKKREARKHNTKDMTWETFIQIKTLC